ncbi:MAG: CBS domain-containing protein [Chloroflexi bacterium]|nr:CBS domain-containing protein [Chloroflexota bacterium]
MEQQPRDESRATTVRGGGAESWAEAGERIDRDIRLPTAAGSTASADPSSVQAPGGSNLGRDRSSSVPAGGGSTAPDGDAPYADQHWDERQPQPQFLDGEAGWASTGSMMRQVQDVMPLLATAGGLAAMATAGGLAYSWWSNRRRKSRYDRAREAAMETLMEMSEVSLPYLMPYLARFGSKVPGAVGRVAANSRSPWVPFALLPIALLLRQRGKQGERASKQLLEPLKLDDRTDDLAKRGADWIEKYGRRLIRDNTPFPEDEGRNWTVWLAGGAVVLGGGYFAYRNGWIGSTSGGYALSSMTSSDTASLGAFGASEMATGMTQSGSTLVRDVMTRDVEIASSSTPIAEVARKMRDLGVGSLPICDSGRLLGMVTDRDLSVRAMAEGRDPVSTTARDVMSPDAVWVFEDQPAAVAANVMRQRQIRRLPVLDRGERLVGIVALGDLATELPDDRLKGATLEAISEPPTASRAR